MKLILPFIFSQWDLRWQHELLGNNTEAKFNQYNYGCLINCGAMIAQYYGYKQNPSILNKKLIEEGGYEKNNGVYVWGAMKRIFSKITSEKVVRTPEPLTDEQLAEIRNSLDAGYPVMIQIDYNPKTVFPEMHFVLVIGYDPSDENNLTIADPLGGIVRSLKDYLGWYKPSARNTIQKYIIYKGKVPGKLKLKDTVIDFDDMENKRRTVGWYVQAWFDQKMEKAENKKKFEVKLHNKDVQFKKTTDLLEYAVAEIKRKETRISKLNDKVLFQSARIDRLNTEISTKYTISDLVTLLIYKLTPTKQK